MKKCCNRLRLRAGVGVNENLPTPTPTPTPVKTTDSGRLRFPHCSVSMIVSWQWRSRLIYYWSRRHESGLVILILLVPTGISILYKKPTNEPPPVRKNGALLKMFIAVQISNNIKDSVPS